MGLRGIYKLKNRNSQKATQSGFTITEILIVVVVVGILAAVSLVAYSNIQTTVAQSVVKSSLQQASKELDIMRVREGTYPNTEDGITKSEDVKYGYTQFDGGYCLTGWSNEAKASYHVASSASGLVLEGPCDEHAEYCVIGDEDSIESLYGPGCGVVRAEVAAWESCDYMPSTRKSFRYIAFGEGVFVTADGDRAYLSSDGCTWTQSSSVGNQTVGDITYGPAGFLVGSSSGNPIAYRASGGSGWYAPSRNPVNNNPLYTMNIHHLAPTPSGFVATRSGGGIVSPSLSFSAMVRDSKNYLVMSGTWGLPMQFTGQDLAVASSTEHNIVVFSAKNQGLGVYNTHISPIVRERGLLPGTWTALDWHQGEFTAISSTGDRVATSVDGIEWTVRYTTGLGSGYTKLAQGDGYYVAVRNDETIATSKDGVIWREYVIPGVDSSYRFTDVAFGDGRFVALSSRPYVLSLDNL